ncbi:MULTISPECIES: hypothetical protein [Caloramator]|uniref:Helix-turn-helix domain-containing protein n=1 Tax=Caloramator proteoclasticus DSM 10124 TaxID=1121262 RepID=A0A1M4WRQ0_9CLOT|nr:MULTISPECIES: hypothetical protein [Caloramator]SHE83916.1 hypothetical protein SAMN02746091_01222 [Caloramator proteoclasticus DSM 10124]
MKKKRTNGYSETYVNPLDELDYERYSEMMENGYTDSDIAKELKVSEKFVKRLRQETKKYL